MASLKNTDHFPIGYITLIISKINQANYICFNNITSCKIFALIFPKFHGIREGICFLPPQSIGTLYAPLLRRPLRL